MDGEPIAASGLRLTPRDPVRIGTMILGGGQWNGRQVYRQTGSRGHAIVLSVPGKGYLPPIPIALVPPHPRSSSSRP